MTASLNDPTLSRLAHSVLWPGFQGLDAPTWLLRALERGLAGAVYFEQNLDPEDYSRVQALSARIHGSRSGALIGVDEEGGVVTRLQARHGSHSPGYAVLGRVDDVSLTEQSAAYIGALVRGAGIDINLAPTVDVNSNPRNPVIGVRSFGTDPELVARHAAAYVRGIQQSGIAACPKHFPGHGDTETDSHLDPATANVSLEELYAVHLAPFKAAIDAGARAMMSAHIRVPALGDAPATLNRTTLGIARELGFDGVLITDAIDMAAVSQTVGLGQGAVDALAAGADLICIGNPGAGANDARERRDEADFLTPLHAVYDALQSGELPVERVEEAVARTAALSAWIEQQTAAPAAPRPTTAFDGAAIAARAAVALGDVRLASTDITVIDARTKRSIAVGDAADFFTVALRETLDPRDRPLTRIALAGLSAAEASARVQQVIATGPGEVVLLINQPQSSAFEAAVLEATMAARPDAVVVWAGWPSEDPVPATRALFTYGASRATAVHAARALAG